MTTRTVLGLTLVMAAVGAQPSVAQHPTTPPPPAALRPLTFPEFQLSKLSNGLEILLVENHELPVVSISLTMPAGSKYAPDGLEGLTDIVSELLTKGTETRTADEIAETIEGVGSSLVASAGQDFLSISTTVLAEYTPLAFELIGDVLLNSTFPENEIELARTRFLSSLQAQKSDPGSLADRYFAKAVYGDHPYGRRPTEASFKAVTREGIQSYVGERLRPGGALLVVAGDISAARVRELAQQSMGAWQGSVPEVTFPEPPPAAATHILLVHRPGSAQSNILVGNLAMRPGDPQYYATVVANRVLGSGSDARLFKILREEKGWTYGAYSVVTRPQEIGYFQANAEVRNEVTDSALVELMNQLRRVQVEAPADSELVAAKGFLVGSFPRQIETPGQVAGRVSNTRLMGLGDDYLETYRERLSAVTPTDAAQAAKYVIQPDSAVIVVVGDGLAVYDGLASMAAVHIIDVDGTPLTAADLNPEVTAIAYDATHLVARRDSFQIIVQGNPMGSRVLELRREGDLLVVEDVLAIPMAGIQQAGTVRMDATSFAPLSNEQRGQMQGQASEVRMTYSGTRVQGTARSPDPSGTPKEIAVDTTLAEGTLDSDALQVLIPAMALADGASFTVNVFAASEGKVQTTTIKVAGVEEVTVPAGTFTTYRLEVQAGETGLILYVSQDAPRRVVKLEIVGQPVTFELVGL